MQQIMLSESCISAEHIPVQLNVNKIRFAWPDLQMLFADSAGEPDEIHGTEVHNEGTDGLIVHRARKFLFEIQNMVLDYAVHSMHTGLHNAFSVHLQSEAPKPARVQAHPKMPCATIHHQQKTIEGNTYRVQ